MRRRGSWALAALVAWCALTARAQAWTRPTHMVTAAIAYDEMKRTRPDLLARLETILDAHPDRGPFQVAIDRTTGPERMRRMFLECSRWADDVRASPHDRPSWHLTFWPVIAPDAPAATKARLAKRGDGPSGEALQGLALNYAVLADTRAGLAEKALSLCWVMHVAGDIHQPLHTAELFSAASPDGDAGGTRDYVRDPIGGAPIVLHWLWDDSVNRSGVVADVDRRAREVEAAYPRAALTELRPFAGPADFTVWAQKESYPLAVSVAYGAGLATSPRPETAPAVPQAKWQEVLRVSERRVALAGYRLAAVLTAALDASAP